MPQLPEQVERVTAVLGIDIAKNTMVLHDSVSGRTWSLANTDTAAREALAPFAGHDLVVCEVTGGYERKLLNAAHALNLPVHRADPAKAKAFIASHGGHAKTDTADARWLARLGLERGASLTRWCPPDAEREDWEDAGWQGVNFSETHTSRAPRHKPFAGKSPYPLLLLKGAPRSGALDLEQQIRPAG